MTSNHPSRPVTRGPGQERGGGLPAGVVAYCQRHRRGGTYAGWVCPECAVLQFRGAARDLDPQRSADAVSTVGCRASPLSASSSSGRTPDFHSGNAGSTPAEVTTRPPRAGQQHEDALAKLLAAEWPVLTFGAWLRTCEVIGPHVAPCFVAQYRWGLALEPARRFVSDFAYPTARLLVEVDGGAHAAGRRKVRTDTERRGLAAAAGWRVLSVLPEQVHDQSAITLVRAALAVAGTAGTAKEGRR